MLNPILAEERIRSHQAELIHQAEVDRLTSQAASDHSAPIPPEALRARVGDLLLAYALKLKGLDIPQGANLGYRLSAALPTLAAPVQAALLPVAAQPRPTSGFSLLCYDNLPAIGLMYWRLDSLGARGAATGGYLTLTWLASQ